METLEIQIQENHDPETTETTLIEKNNQPSNLQQKIEQFAKINEVLHEEVEKQQTMKDSQFNDSDNVAFSMAMEPMTASQAKIQFRGIHNGEQNLQNLTTSDESADSTKIYIPESDSTLFKHLSASEAISIVAVEEKIEYHFCLSGTETGIMEYYYSSKILELKISEHNYTFEVTPENLHHLEKWFFYYFDILIPQHNKFVFTHAELLKQYMKCYIDHIFEKHRDHLFEYLKNNANKLVHKEDQIVSKGWGHLISEKISTICEVVKEKVRKYSTHEHEDYVKKVAVLLTHQVKLAQSLDRCKCVLERVLNDDGLYIASSVFHKLEQKKTYETLAWALWIGGFEEAVKEIKSHQSSSNEIVNEKVEQVLHDGMSYVKEEEEKRREKIQETIKGLYVL